MRTNPEVIDSYPGLGQAIEKSREDRQRADIQRQQARQQAARRPFEAFETARDTVERSHEAGWITNPDRVTIPDDPGMGDGICLGGSIAAQQGRQRRDYEAIAALEAGKQAGTLAGALDQALVEFNRAMDDAGWRQQASLLAQSYAQPRAWAFSSGRLVSVDSFDDDLKPRPNPLPLEFYEPPRSWAALSEENAELREQIDSSAAEIIRLTNMLINAGLRP